MKEALLFIILLFVSIHLTLGQFLSCGNKEMETAQKQHLQKIFSNAAQLNKIARTQAEIHSIPINVNAFRKSDGSGGKTTHQDVIAMIDETNRNFSKTGFQFYLVDSLAYIDSDYYYDFKGGSESALELSYDVANVINVYIPNSIWINSTPVGGYAGARIFIVNIGALSHELGHYFGLPHTHSGNTDPLYRELVERTNCETTGGLFCDTPADPYGLADQQSIINCMYQGTLTDANGDLYQPPIDNIMSYWGGYCGAVFTPQQVEAMQVYRREFYLKDLVYPSPNVASPSQLTALLDTSFSGRQVLLTWKDNSSNELGYFVERLTNTSEHFETIASLDANTTFFTDHQLNFQTAQYRIKPMTPHQDDYSNVVSVSTPDLIYCRPTYEVCPSAKTYIEKVVIKKAETTYLTNAQQACSTYADYMDTTSILSEEESYEVEVYFKDPYPTVLPYSDVAIWIDLDQNKVFDRQEYLYVGQISSFVHKGRFTIPIGVKAGITRMRICAGILHDNMNDACYEAKQAEVRDITFKMKGKIRQTLSFAHLADQQVGVAPFPLTPVSNTTLPISYRILEGGVSIQSDTLYIISAGEVRIRASQAGNDQYTSTWATINFCVLPAKPVIILDKGVLTTFPSLNSSYQWYFNGQAIQGATTAICQSFLLGEYQVEEKGPCGAAVISDIYSLTLTATEQSILQVIKVFPNPASSTLLIELPEDIQSVKLLLIDNLGQVVEKNEYKGQASVELKVAHLPKGLYIVQLQNSKFIVSKKVIIE